MIEQTKRNTKHMKNTKILLTSLFLFSCSKGDDDSFNETTGTNGIQISAENGNEEDNDTKTASSTVTNSTTSGNSSNGNSSENPDCTPGYEGCKCVGKDICLNDLICLSKTCVDAGNSGETTNSNSSDMNGETTKNPEENTTGESQYCDYSFECANTEVCVDGYCGDTDNYYFNVTVLMFQPNTCEEDGIGTVELYYIYYMNDIVQQVSNITDYCPGEWANTQLYYDSLQTFAIDFWESDPIDDDYYGRWCFQDENENCIPVPKQILHDGYIGDDTIEWTFDPIPFGP